MLDFEKMFVRIVSIAHYPKTGAVSLCEVGPKVDERQTLRRISDTCVSNGFIVLRNVSEPSLLPLGKSLLKFKISPF